MKKQRPGKTSTRILAEFDDAARTWGYMEDQGIGQAVATAEQHYREAKAKLEKRLAHLEASSTSYRQRLSAPRSRW